MEVSAWGFSVRLVQKLKICFVSGFNFPLSVVDICREHFEIKGTAIGLRLFLNGFQKLVEFLIIRACVSLAVRGLHKQKVRVGF